MTIRRYMVIAVLSIVVFPVVVYIAISVMVSQFGNTQSLSQQASLSHTLQVLAQNPPSWTSPRWRHQMDSQLQRQGIDAEIRSPSNRVIFSSQPAGRPPGFSNPHGMVTQQMLVMNNRRPIAIVQASQMSYPDPIAGIGALLACVLAILFVSVQIGRNVIKPLESMSRAALRIAEGDLDFTLDSSKAKEIRQVRHAFYVMKTGLQDAFSRQQKLEEERRFFIGAIAHDLRTPLFALRGYLDGIAQGVAASPEKISHYVAMSQQKAAHLERLVSDLFAFTRLEYLEATLARQHFNLMEMVETMVENLMQRCQEKGIRVNVKAPEEELSISGDPHLLERAFTNVMDNAQRYTPAGGTISLEVKTEPDRVIVTVMDTGPGFPPEDLTRVFEPLYRGDAARRVATGGAGLGLTIARRSFRAHGGDLRAENLPNGGALLTGWLPLNDGSQPEG